MDDCIEWTGSVAKNGYGRLCLNGKYILAHRLVWKMVFGAIPPGICVCHRCDNRSCINPDHLFLGTGFDNMQDMVSKGRHSNQKKLLCKNGHEYQGHTRIRSGKTSRLCMVCLKTSWRKATKKYKASLERYRG
jgi:hypothetical protein